MKQISIFIAALLVSATAWGQQPNIIVTGERDNGRYIKDMELNVLRNSITRLGENVTERVTLFGERVGYGVFTVVVYVVCPMTNRNIIAGALVTSSAGTLLDVIKQRAVKIDHAMNTLMVFNVPSGGTGWGAAWTYRYFWVQGDVKAKPNTKFAYRLPFEAGMNVRYMEYINSDGHTNVTNYLWMNFFFDNEQTVVYPIRDGLVVNIDNNGVFVQHSDGTVANYADVMPIVQIGQRITANQPFATTTEKRLIIGLYHYTYDKNININDGTPFIRNYLNPIFATPNGKRQLIDGENFN